MTDLSNRLHAILNDEKTPTTVIGTAGSTDFQRLIEHSSDLIEEVEKSNASENEKKQLRKKLEEVVSRFKDIQEKKLFDTQILYPLAGTQKGIVRQSFFTESLLDRIQKHTAVQDVKDLAEILKKLSPDIKKGIEKLVCVTKQHRLTRCYLEN
jgi:hypothetical protein